MTPPARRRDRREGRRLLDRRARTRQACRSSLVVIGAGVIGLELGSVWRRLGAEVLVVEFLDRILPGMDARDRAPVPAHPGKAGHAVQAVLEGHEGRATKGKGVKAHDRAGRRRRGRDRRCRRGAGRDRPRPLHRRARARGRSACSATPRGASSPTRNFATNVTGIYAIGDVIAGPMLAHKAEDEGVAVAEILAGKAGHVNYDVIPNVVYTEPEVASVGQDRGGAEGRGHRLQGRQVPVHGERPRQGQPHHRRLREDPRRRDDRPRARRRTSSARTPATSSRECAHRAWNSAPPPRTSPAPATPHPTLTEAVKEAALAVEKRAIHM